MTSKFTRVLRKALDFVVAEADKREDESFHQSVEMRFEESESRFGIDTIERTRKDESKEFVFQKNRNETHHSSKKHKI